MTSVVCAFLGAMDALMIHYLILFYIEDNEMLRLKIEGMWKSLTIWFNGLMAIVIPGLPMLKDSFPDLQPYLPAHLYQWIIGLLIVANILLRFRTTKSLADK